MELQKATLGTGCFWCTEAALKLLPGVVSVVPGYAGGIVEAVQIEYDPSKTSYGDLLKIFWEIHDPMQENGQGSDKGPEYQAVIFFHTLEQQKLAEETKRQVEEKLGKQVATKIHPFVDFREAEDYHKDYYAKNPDNPYSKAVIAPKVEKAKKIIGKL